MGVGIPDSTSVGSTSALKALFLAGASRKYMLQVH